MITVIKLNKPRVLSMLYAKTLNVSSGTGSHGLFETKSREL